MKRSPKNVRIAFNHRGLTHYGGVFFFHEFLRVLQLRRLCHRQLRCRTRNSRYSLPQMLLGLIYPIILGLDRLETAAFLRDNGTFQYLTGLGSYPDPQSLRRFLLQAPPQFREQLHRLNDRLLRQFIHQPEHRSRLILDLDSSVLTVFGHQEGAAVGYNPRYRGKRSYDPLLCLEANSAFLWDTELRPGNAGTWAGSVELLASCFLSAPRDIREVRVRADAGFGYDPVLTILEERPAEYAVVARMTSWLKRVLGGLYSFSGVVPRLSRSAQICSATQTVNNAVAMPTPNPSFQKKSPQGNFGLGSGTNGKSARATSLAQLLDRSRNPNADTHSQVPTPHVSPYTACAPRSHKAS